MNKISRRAHCTLREDILLDAMIKRHTEMKPLNRIWQKKNKGLKYYMNKNTTYRLTYN